MNLVHNVRQVRMGGGWVEESRRVEEKGHLYCIRAGALFSMRNYLFIVLKPNLPLAIK
jgi:allantoicase